MEKIRQNEYGNYISRIDRCARGAVYPLSIAESNQPGDIFICRDAVLFWHRCGFAFICGGYDAAFIREVYETFLGRESAVPRRFILLSDDAGINRFLAGKDGILTEHRLFFEYPADAVPAALPDLPDGMILREIDEYTYDKLAGRNIPRVFWKDMPEFLDKGRGYCVLDGNIPAAWAFSAAIGGGEIDIGVETDPGYRRRGLAAAAVSAMIRYILRLGRRPVWSCREDNTGSRGLAEKSGFVLTSGCTVFRKRE